MPVLIGLGCVLVLAQPWISRHVKPPESRRRRTAPCWVWLLVYAAGVYGGYFGAAQGVLLIAILGLGLAESLQRINATKNVLAGLVNAVAALVFIAISEVSGRPPASSRPARSSAASSARPSAAGCLPPVLRGFVAVVGVVAIVKLVFLTDVRRRTDRHSREA